MAGLRALVAPLLFVAAATCTTAPAPSRHFIVYSLWQRGANEHDREEIDRFLDCLLVRSSFADFWRGSVTVQAGGSWVVDSPGSRLDDEATTERWLSRAIQQNGLPDPPAGTTPIYVLFGTAGVVGSSCGRVVTLMHDGQRIGAPFVRAAPPCWPANLGTVRSETASLQHELVETIDALLDRPACAADGPCETGEACGGNAACASFIGLSCPGAPESSFTGCDATPVRGWVIQKVSHASEQGADCPPCPTCDFAPTVIH